MMKRLLRLILLAALCMLPATAFAREPEIAFNLESGFYDAPQTLKITCSQRKTTIYYTLDGSLPDENSLVYEGPITLGNSNEREDVLTRITGIAEGEQYVPEVDFPTGHVIRAIAISSAGERSEVISATYMIGYDREALYGDTPVMFLVTDPAGLFDHEKGIYVLGAVYDAYQAEKAGGNEDAEFAANFTQRGDEWERPVTVTFLDASGDGFTQDMGMRIKGGASRQRAQKSLRLIAREEYGEKNVKYELYPDNVRESDGEIVNKYKSFTLRNGGNDTNRAKVRDPLFANLATGLRFDTAQNMPCIAFLNGEYWGLYTLNEEYTDNYIQYHYDIDNENVIIYKNGEIDEGLESDQSLANEMLYHIGKEDMSIPENYQRATELLDVGSYADYCALHMYLANVDGPFQNWNWQMWRVRDPEPETHACADGKWRMMLFDVDGAAGLYSDGSDAAEDNITPILTAEYDSRRHPAWLLISLLQNDTFKKEFLRSMCDIRNLYFCSERVSVMLPAMVSEYRPNAPETLLRFGFRKRAEDAELWYDNRVKDLESFLAIRYDAFLPIVQNAFGLSEACAITVEVADAAKGQVYFNGRTLPAEDGAEYLYFPECGVTVTAVPARGAKFTGWTVSGDAAVVADPDALTTEVAFTGAFTLTANFE